MIDSHSHILKEYYNDIDELVKKLKNSNILGVINCSDSISSAEEVIEYSRKYQNFLFSSIGIHPQNLFIYKESDFFELEKMLDNNKIVAIGEIGLDYYCNKENKDLQRKYFKKQIELAINYKLPIIIHSRDSIQDTFDIINQYKCRGVIHCFSGSLEMANKFINNGFYIGIGGVLTFKNSKLYEVIEKIDLKNILLETDSPFLSPEPYRGIKNIPSNVYYVAKKISEIKNITIEEVINTTTNNCIKLFDLHK